MYKFEFFMPTKVLFGASQLSNLHLEKMPGKKALIVTSNGSSTKKYGYLEAVERELDLAGFLSCHVQVRALDKMTSTILPLQTHAFLVSCFQSSPAPGVPLVSIH